MGGEGGFAIRSGGADHASSNVGGSYWGGGVYNRAQTSTGLEANNPGTGGSGAYQATGGGAGAAGIVVVWEYK